MDQHLTWKSRIENVIQRIRKTTAPLCSVRFYVDQWFLVMHSALGGYCLFDKYVTRLDKLFKQQKKI